MPEPYVPVLDPVAAYPQIAVLRDALARRDWPACRALLDNAPAVERTAWIQSDLPAGLEGFLRAVLERDPADSTAAALLGEHLVDVGWEIRTNALADQVSREQFAALHEWLCKAEQVLIAAAAHRPDDPAVWTVRLITAMGLGLDKAELKRRYARLAKLDPCHLPAQRRMVQALQPKWSGSWEMLHEFSREAMLAAPPGAPHAMLVAEAHIEHMVCHDTEAERVAYLQQDAVRDECYEAARRSVWHPAFRRSYGWVTAVGMFAMVFAVNGDRAATASMFSMLGNLGSEYPWRYVSGDAAEGIRSTREWALGGA